MRWTRSFMKNILFIGRGGLVFESLGINGIQSSHSEEGNRRHTFSEFQPTVCLAEKCAPSQRREFLIPPNGIQHPLSLDLQTLLCIHVFPAGYPSMTDVLRWGLKMKNNYGIIWIRRCFLHLSAARMSSTEAQLSQERKQFSSFSLLSRRQLLQMKHNCSVILALVRRLQKKAAEQIMPAVCCCTDVRERAPLNLVYFVALSVWSSVCEEEHTCSQMDKDMSLLNKKQQLLQTVSTATT